MAAKVSDQIKQFTKEQIKVKQPFILMFESTHHMVWLSVGWKHACLLSVPMIDVGWMVLVTTEAVLALCSWNLCSLGSGILSVMAPNAASAVDCLPKPKGE